MRLHFDPLDVLFFRDSRPFSAGEAASASSQAPLPSVFYGALRTHLLAAAGADFGEYADSAARAAWTDPALRAALQAVGEPGGAGSLRTKGPFYAAVRETKLADGRAISAGTLLLPTPFDMVERGGKLSCLKPDAPKDDAWGPPIPAMAPLKAEGAKKTRGLLAEGDFAELMGGKAISKERLLTPESILGDEPRVGIGVRAEANTVEPGLFYSAQFIRMREGFGYACEVEGVDKVPEGSLFLGGERRTARLSRMKDVRFHAAPKVAGRRFKIALLTPAVFSKGWRPGWIGDDGEGTFAGLRLRVVAAAVEKPMVFSGWDMAARRPKPIRRAAPAGSVYVFELLEGDPGKVAEAFHFRAISDALPEAGFGVAAVGAVPA